MVAHVLVVERPDGLLLVDTGFGTADVAAPQRIGRAVRALMRPKMLPEETAIAQLTALGYTADDVTDIVLTHLDVDHAGGVGDFPHARVHLDAAELEAGRHPRGAEHGRYVREQWAEADFVPHAAPPAGGDAWFGFESVTEIGDGVLLVPLPGHSRGHSMVAVRDGDGWLAHAGDAYFHPGDLTSPPSAPRTVRVVQRLLAQDDAVRLANRDRLAELVAADHPDLRVFCAHDRAEFEAFGGPAGGGTGAGFPRSTGEI